MKAIVVLAAASMTIASCDGIPGTEDYAARRAVRNAMIDPGAAKVSILHRSKVAVCGTVNGKNRMGAYVGATPFIYDTASGEVRQMQEAPTIYDYSTWSDTQDPGRKSESYDKIEVGCDFPARWAKSCSKETAAAIPRNEPFCELWRKQDFSGLYNMAHRTY